MTLLQLFLLVHLIAYYQVAARPKIPFEPPTHQISLNEPLSPEPAAREAISLPESLPAPVVVEHTPAELPATESKTETVQGVEMQSTDYTATVVFEPQNKSTLAVQVPAQVLEIKKWMGQPFKKGDVLIQLDDDIYKSNFLKAEAALNKAKAILAAKEGLFNDQIVSLMEYKDAQAQYAAAEADYTLAKKQLDACLVKAPYDGKVNSLLIAEYELPQPGQAVIEIVGDNVLIAKFLIDSSLLNEIDLGMPISIQVKELGQTIEARILRIGAVIDPASSTVRVDAEIDNRDSLLLTGMSGFTTLALPPRNLDAHDISEGEQHGH